jgi:hypothetical protein
MWQQRLDRAEAIQRNEMKTLDKFMLLGSHYGCRERTRLLPSSVPEL